MYCISFPICKNWLKDIEMVVESYFWSRANSCLTDDCIIPVRRQIYLPKILPWTCYPNLPRTSHSPQNKYQIFLPGRYMPGHSASHSGSGGFECLLATVVRDCLWRMLFLLKSATTISFLKECLDSLITWNEKKIAGDGMLTAHTLRLNGVRKDWHGSSHTDNLMGLHVHFRCSICIQYFETISSVSEVHL